MINLGEQAFVIEHGLRIAQLVLAPFVQATFQQVSSLDNTARGEAGFGSTGLK